LKSTATSSTQSTTSSSNFLHDTKPVPESSQQTEITHPEALQAWLIKTHELLSFLSEIERSVSLANLISSFDKQLQTEASKENSIKLLLALDDFVKREKNDSLSIQFFIEKILKNCRFIIDNYHDTYAKLLSLEKTVNQSSLTEDPKQLQIKLFDLNKEKKQLQKSLLPDFELTRLLELTNDLEKFRREHDRDFVHEIAMHAAELETYAKKLDEINEKAAKIEEELTFPIDQLEANLNIKKRKLLHLEVDWYTLKQIGIDSIIEDIIEKLLEQLKLENTRLSLISELEECDPIKILKTQIEHPNTRQEELRTESKIKKDLAQNAQNLNAITEFFKDLIQLVPTKNNNIIKDFLEKIQLTLNLNIDKNALEAKQSKTNDENTTLQEELVVFLQQNSSELIEHLKKLAEDKQEEKTKLQIEIQNLEILDEKIRLNSQISELEEKIQTTKNDQNIFSIIEDNNLLEPLIYLERLQKITNNTIHNIDELQKQITELKKEIDKEDVAKSDFDSNKEKIKSRKKIKILEEKVNEYNLNIKKQKIEQELEKQYRNEIEKEINKIRNIKTTAWLSKLPHNERNLRFNSVDIELLTKNIEKQKINATQKKEWKRTKNILNQTEALLLNKAIETSENNNTEELIFFNFLKAQLIDLKEWVENPIWNKSGWSFFSKKTPDGIQKIREIFNAKPFNTSISEVNIEQNNFTMLSLFLEIYPLIQQKNSSTKYLRSSTVKNFYQLLLESLTQVNNQFLTLNEPVEMHGTVQPTCSNSSF